MDTEILQGIGLTEAQAKTYLRLLEVGEIPPPELAKDLGETRTNMYSILEQLQAKSLAIRVDEGKKIRYRPAHPVNLESFVERRRNVILNWEYKLTSILPGMVKNYFATTEQPEVRFFQGREALERVYEDIIETRQDFKLIMTPIEHDFMGEKFMNDFVKTRVKKKIWVEALTPNTPEANHRKDRDKKILLRRTFYNPEAFDVPVEINIYGDKVAYLSFGNEVFGTIIHSPQIAKGMAELFNMIKLASIQVK